MLFIGFVPRCLKCLGPPWAYVDKNVKKVK